jgi:hypothetical protein
VTIITFVFYMSFSLSNLSLAGWLALKNLKFEIVTKVPIYGFFKKNSMVN